MKNIMKKYESILMIIMGIICIVFQKQIYSVFPLVFGLFLLERGINKCYYGYKNGDLKNKNGVSLEQSIIIVIIALGIMIKQDTSLIVAAMSWGLAGLVKSVKYLNELFYEKFKNGKFKISLFVAFLIELILSFILIFEPIGNIEHHILILGIQLIIEAILGLFIKIKNDIKK